MITMQTIVRVAVSVYFIVGSTMSALISRDGRQKLEDNFDQLPASWRKLCKTSEGSQHLNHTRTLSNQTKENLLQLSCKVFPDDVTLRFSDFRRWSETLDRKVALEITCDAGVVHLPWPMKARNLVFLTIKGCQVEGYFSEYSSAEILKIPDELRVLELRDVVFYFNPLELPDLIRNTSTTPPDFECGPLTLETFIISNRTFELKIDEKNCDEFLNATSSWDFEELFQTLLRGVDNQSFTCNFTHLRQIDESYNPDLGSLYFTVLTKKSAFPEVTLLNVSHTTLPSAPAVLTNWTRYYPKLSTLDLSYNHINRFDFAMDSSATIRKGRHLTVDLRYNNISALTLKDVRRLLTSSDVTVRLKNNPFLTDCILFSRFDKVTTSDAKLIQDLSNSRYTYLLTSPCGHSDADTGGVPNSSRTNSPWAVVLLCLLLIFTRWCH